MNFRHQVFSALYHPQDARDEKVSSVLACGEHGEKETLDSSGIHRIHGIFTMFPTC